jgi:hypothetical protein
MIMVVFHQPAAGTVVTAFSKEENGAAPMFESAPTERQSEGKAPQRWMNHWEYLMA